MTVATPFHSSWLDGDDVILQDGNGQTARINADDLVLLHAEASDSDSEHARHGGIDWHRDHLCGALDLAARAGLIDRCVECGTPTSADPRDARPRCARHKREQD